MIKYVIIIGGALIGWIIHNGNSKISENIEENKEIKPKEKVKIIDISDDKKETINKTKNSESTIKSEGLVEEPENN